MFDGYFITKGPSINCYKINWLKTKRKPLQTKLVSSLICQTIGLFSNDCNEDCASFHIDNQSVIKSFENVISFINQCFLKFWYCSRNLVHILTALQRISQACLMWFMSGENVTHGKSCGPYSEPERDWRFLQCVVFLFCFSLIDFQRFNVCFFNNESIFKLFMLITF